MSAITRFRRKGSRRQRRPIRMRLQVERVEDRLLLSHNVLVNDAAADDTALDTQSEAAIVLGSDSRIVVAYNDTGERVNGAHSRVGWSLSTNGGASFSDQGTVPIDPDHGPCCHAVLARSNLTGTIFLATLAADPSFSGPPCFREKININRSTDNGSTFQAAVNGASGFVAGVDFHIWEWIAVDNFAGPGQGNVYMAWRDESTDPSKNGLLFTRSTDDGLTWGPDGATLIAAVPKSGQLVHGAFTAVGPDHAVYVSWIDFEGHKEILIKKSTDHGVSFGPPVSVALLKTSTWHLFASFTQSSDALNTSFCGVLSLVDMNYTGCGTINDRGDFVFIGMGVDGPVCLQGRYDRSGQVPRLGGVYIAKIILDDASEEDCGVFDIFRTAQPDIP